MQKSSVPKRPSADAGFTLIELAIALVIIGLLLYGLLIKGTDLIEDARLNVVSRQVGDIRLAVTTFQDRYNALPGDYSQASTTIKTGLKNGNQDGVVAGEGLDPDAEAFNFWSHLVAADFFPEVGIAQQTGASFGQGAPTSKIGGGFTVKNNPTEGIAGLWLVLGNKKDKTGEGALLTPAQAKKLDQKMDNGNPTTGNIRALDVSGAPEAKCLKDGAYNLLSKEVACVMYFKL